MLTEEVGLTRQEKIRVLGSCAGAGGCWRGHTRSAVSFLRPIEKDCAAAEFAEMSVVGGLNSG